MEIKNKQTKQNKHRFIEIETKGMVVRGEGGVGMCVKGEREDSQ